MLVLRLANPETAGLESDDGFVIGRVTTATLILVFGSAAIGAVGGSIYVALRSSLPDRFRTLLWTCALAAGGGAAFVHEDGLDFQLDPAWFAIASFVLLPGLAALAVALLVERWLTRVDPSVRFTRAIAASALLGTLGLVVAVLVCGAAFSWRRLPGTFRGRLERAARVAVPALFAGQTVYAGIDLVRTAVAIL